MASKLDKLRKLHADKMLDADDLDNIAGGTKAEIADDSRFLNVLLRGHPRQCDRWGEYNAGLINHPAIVAEAWKACGIRMDPERSNANSYRDLRTGRYISQEEARELAMENMGKRLNRSDWYW